MKRGAWLLVWLLSASSAAAQNAARPPPEPLGKDDFAHAIELEVDPNLAVQTLLVPLAVYRGALSRDLHDVRVLDASGAPVPHALRGLPTSTEVEHGERGVPLFPLLAKAPDGRLEDLALHIERSENGTVIDVRSSDAPADAGSGHVVAYILDLSALEHDVIALQLKTAPVKESYVAPITIEASDDLARFTPIARDVALARLMHDGQEVLRDQIELPRTRAQFLRVRWQQSELPAQITAATVALAPGTALPQHSEELRVVGELREQRDAAGAQVYDFDLGGALTIERAQVVLGPSSLVQATLSAADGDYRGLSAAQASAQRAYTPLYEGQLYRLAQNGKELSSPGIDVDHRRYRYFALHVREPSTALSPPPELIARYAPVQLVFVARGAAPFVLAYGSHKAPSTSFDADALLAALGPDARKALPIATAKLGAEKTLAGKAALSPPPPPAPIKTYALWAILIASAGVLAVLAFRLLRKL